MTRRTFIAGLGGIAVWSPLNEVVAKEARAAAGFIWLPVEILSLGDDASLEAVFSNLAQKRVGPACRVITHREAFLLRQHHDVEAIFRHIDSAKREHSHLRTPSLLMRARALATVRVWKKRPELHAHSRFAIQDDCGLPVATGAVS
jgi:hypothetical protein